MFWNNLTEFPGTAAKTLNAIICELVMTLAIAYCLIAQKTVDKELAALGCSFVLGIGGVTTWRYRIERKTDRKLNEIQSRGPSPVTLKDPKNVDIIAPATAATPAATGATPSVVIKRETTPGTATIRPLTHRTTEAGQ